MATLQVQGVQEADLRAQIRAVLDGPECDESGLRLGLNVISHVGNLHALGSREDGGHRHATVGVTASGFVYWRA